MIEVIYKEENQEEQEETAVQIPRIYGRSGSRMRIVKSILKTMFTPFLSACHGQRRETPPGKPR